MRQKMKNSIWIIILVIFWGIIIFSNEVRASEVRASEVQTEYMEIEKGSAEEMEVDTELVFDADVTWNRTAAKSALADMHGIFVFRDAFITQEKSVKEAEKKKRQQIEKIVLISEQPDLNAEEWVDLVLKADKDKYIKEIHFEEENSDMFLWIYCIAISICVFCMVIRADDYFKKKKEKKQARPSYERFETFIVLFMICIPLMTGCGKGQNEKGFTDGILEALKTEGNVEKTLDLENDSELWVRTGNTEENRGEMELFVYERKAWQITRLDAGIYNGVVNVGNDQEWKYYDVNDDGRKDIVATGTFLLSDSEDGTEVHALILVQTEDNTYEAETDEWSFRPILKRA